LKKDTFKKLLLQLNLSIQLNEVLYNKCQRR